MAPLLPPKAPLAVPALLLAAAAAWLACSTSPGIGPLDAGDMSTASATLGVPHATGFPVNTLLGRAAMFLPVGTLAQRAALVSAAATACAIAVGAWLAQARSLTLRARSVLAAGGVALGTALVAATDTLALHAAVAEVYALHLALTLAALASLDALERSRDARWAIVIALLTGIGIANHALFRLQAPIFVAATWYATPRGARLRAACAGAAFGTLALAAYAYLPLAAARAPEHNWGNPSTWSAFWAHVTAADIREAFGDQMAPSGRALGHHARVLIRQLAAGPGVALFAGLLALSRCALRGGGAQASGSEPATRGDALWPATIACVLADAAYAIALNPMGLRDAQNAQVLAFVGSMGAIWALGATRAGYEGRGPGGLLGQGALAALLVALVLPQLGTRHGSLARDWSAEDHAAATLLLATPDPLILTVTDTQSAAHLYLDAAVDARPDAAVFGRHVLTSGPAAAYTLTQQPFAIVEPERLEEWATQGNDGDPSRTLAVLTSHVGRRSIYWEPAIISSELPRGLTLAHRWPLGTVQLADRAEDECEPASTAWCAGVPPWAAEARAAAGSGGYFAGRFVAKQLSFRGARALRAGRADLALELFESAHAFDASLPNFATGAAVASATLGEVESALRWSLLALSINPASGTARDNAIQYAAHLELGEIRDALQRGAVPSYAE